MRRIRTILGAAVIILLLGTTLWTMPTEAQYCSSCQTCKRIGMIFPIDFCAPAKCETSGGCDCNDSSGTCYLHGAYCFHGCIIVT